MSLVTVDFNKLKYNLYDILGIDKTADIIKIKKAFRKLIMNFHPDKNSNIDDEVYQHIMTANQILTNNENRESYDKFLLESQDTHESLKKKFNNLSSSRIIDKSKEECAIDFQIKFKELEKKHIKNHNVTDDDIKNKFNKLLEKRNNEINIINENFQSNDDFNTKFEERINNGEFSDQLIESNINMELSSYNVNSNYTLLDIAYGDNNLYVDGGGITTDRFSSLDSAFKLQPINPKNFKEKKMEDQIKEYNSFTEELPTIKYNKNDTFELW